MRRGLVLTIFVVSALIGFPAAASADPDDPIVYLSPADGWIVPQGADVSFGFACVSPGSGIVSCEGSQPLGSKLDTFHAGPHTLSVTATDYEGRQTTATTTYTVFDITKPHVVFRTPADGALFDLGSSATIDYACEDDPGGLGILDGGCIGTYPIGMPVDTRSLGTFAFSVTAVDKQFNLTQETIHYSVIDRTPPTITFSSPGDGATYTLGQQVWASFSCEARHLRAGHEGVHRHGVRPRGERGATDARLLDRVRLRRLQFPCCVVSDRDGDEGRHRYTAEILPPWGPGRGDLRLRLARLDSVRRPRRPDSSRRIPVLQRLCRPLHLPRGLIEVLGRHVP